MPSLESEARDYSLNPAQVRFGLRISIYEGIFATIHGTLIGGVFLTGLALRWGANTFQIGLLSAIPALFAASGFLSALLVARQGVRKPLTLITSVLGRSVFVAFLPFLLLHNRMPMPAFLAVMAGFNLLLVFAGNAWTSWMGDLVPEDRRGSYFGLRNTVMSLTTMVFTFAAGRFLDRYKTDSGFAYVCGTAVLAGVIAMFLLRIQPEPRTIRPDPKPVLPALRAIIAGPLADPGFRKFLRFIGIWSLLAPLASPFYIVHLLKNLTSYSYSVVAVYVAISSASAIVFQWLWGRAIDRFSAKPIIFINLFCTGFLPLLWIFATPRFLLPVWLDGIGNGLFWTGATLAWFNLLLGFAQGKKFRDAYFALFTATAGLAGFVSSLIGGTIAQALTSFHWPIGGFRFVNFHVIFLLAAIGRFASLWLLKPVPDERAAPVSTVLVGIGDYTLRRLNYGKDLVLEGVSVLTRRVFPPRN